jgi:predicted GTPase
MKKVLVGCVAVMSLGFGEPYTQGDRILDMQKMAQAMQDIQAGFFYNNLDIVRAGAEDLKKTIVKVGPTQAELSNKDIYEKWMNNNTAMTHRIQNSIEKRTETIIKRFESGDPVQALQEYSKITRECMKCHISLRKW